MADNICPKCGYNYKAGAKFCPECGCKLKGAAQTPVKDEPLFSFSEDTAAYATEKFEGFDKQLKAMEEKEKREKAEAERKEKERKEKEEKARKEKEERERKEREKREREEKAKEEERKRREKETAEKKAREEAQRKAHEEKVAAERAAALKGLANARVYDTVKFGRYRQFSGTEEPIEWYVISNNCGEVLLLSKYILDVVDHNRGGQCTSWATSPVRKWLNSDFYNQAFNEGEQSIMVSVKLSSCRKIRDVGYAYNPKSKLEVTIDKVFVPTDNDHGAIINSMPAALQQTKPTEYAIGHGIVGIKAKKKLLRKQEEYYQWYKADGIDYVIDNPKKYFLECFYYAEKSFYCSEWDVRAPYTNFGVRPMITVKVN